MPKNDKKEVLEGEVLTSNNVSTKGGIVAGGIALIGGATNSFALASTDFDVTTAVADMGYAAVAVITLGVLALGYGFVRKIL